MNNIHSTKQLYYVSVINRTVLTSATDAAYEFTIYADDDDIRRLIAMFHELERDDGAAAIHFTKTPYETASDQQMNAGTDQTQLEIYKFVFAHGTAQTRRDLIELNPFGAADVELADELWCTDWR